MPQLRDGDRAGQIARVPRPPTPPQPDDARPPSSHASSPGPDSSHDGAPPRRLGDPVDERPIPRGCHPFTFGIVMATIQFAVTLYFMRSC